MKKVWEKYVLKLNGMKFHDTSVYTETQWNGVPFFHTHIWQRTAPKQLLARIARTESNSGVRQNRQVLPGRAKAPNEMSSQRELKIFNKSMCTLKFTYLNENLLHFSKLHILAEGNFSFLKFDKIFHSNTFYK